MSFNFSKIFIKALELWGLNDSVQEVFTHNCQDKNLKNIYRLNICQDNTLNILFKIYNVNLIGKFIFSLTHYIVP